MADYAFVDETGVIIPDTGTVKATVEGEFKAALGQDLITADNTPQGALIVAETTARAAVLQNNAVVANQINPNLAGGVFLDAIWALVPSSRGFPCSASRVLSFRPGRKPRSSTVRCLRAFRPLLWTEAARGRSISEPLNRGRLR